VIAHVSGVPVEEALPALVGWASVGLALARGWVASRLAHRR
jgi:hypothetical protein